VDERSFSNSLAAENHNFGFQTVGHIAATRQRYLYTSVFGGAGVVREAVLWGGSDMRDASEPGRKEMCGWRR
jgi:hypothetical protein